MRLSACVTLRIIWPNFLRAIWHIRATSCPTDLWAFRRGSIGSFITRSSRLISRIRRISDQNTVQKSNVSGGHSDDRICQISSKTLCQIIRKVTYFFVTLGIILRDSLVDILRAATSSASDFHF
jgi:hypothetical protein